MNAKTKKGIKIGAFVLLGIIGAFILVVCGYLLYVVCSYSRIEDNLALSINNNKTETAATGEAYSLMSYNIGFGAYSHDFSFFLDTGTTKDGVNRTGTRGTAISKDDVIKNTEGALSVLKAQNPTFAFLQEVDTKADRSYKVNQLEYFTALEDYSNSFAENFHSAYLFYPFGDPHGASNAGLATLSKLKIDSGVRRSYPISDSLSKFLDLDRCFAVYTVPVDGGKNLYLINHHMSAYDEGGVIRAQQVEMITAFISELYNDGNYVILGGDFNHDLANSKELFETDEVVPSWVADWVEVDTPEGFKVYADNSFGTCRNADMPYKKGVSYTVTIDGFIVSDNITVSAVRNVDTDFEFSDHNPVMLEFSLNA